MSASAEQCAEQIKTALHSAARLDAPYRHWRLAETFPADVIDAINRLELAAPSWEGADGRRAWNNERVFVDPSMMAKEPKARALAEGLQSADVLAVIEDMCGLDLTGDFLRIEYCMDSQGFWLEPHTDLGVKHLTLLAYCARDEAAAGWGTSFAAPQVAAAALLLGPELSLQERRQAVTLSAVRIEALEGEIAKGRLDAEGAVAQAN